MNGKKAKPLRRQAESLTVGKPNVSYSRESLTNVMGRRCGYRIVLSPDCTRAVYKRLKLAA